MKRRLAIVACLGYLTPCTVLSSAGTDGKGMNPAATETPRLCMKVMSWSPLDISEEIKKADKELYSEFCEPKNPGPGLIATPNWIVQQTLISSNRRWQVFHLGFDYLYLKEAPAAVKLTRELAERCGNWLLVDTASRRIYTISSRDTERVAAEIPDSGDLTILGPMTAADNGALAYQVHWEKVKGISSKEDFTRNLLLDFRNGRKYVFSGEYIPDIQHFMIGGLYLADEGNRVGIQDYAGLRGSFRILDLDTQAVVYQSPGELCAVNGDASVIIYYLLPDGSYMRREIDASQEEVSFSHHLTHTNIHFSPDGNFCACDVLNFGPSYIEVYEHNLNRHFEIDDPDYYEDDTLSIDNDGTLVASSGVYVLKDGHYLQVPGTTSEDRKKVDAEQM